MTIPTGHLLQRQIASIDPIPLLVYLLSSVLHLCSSLSWDHSAFLLTSLQLLLSLALPHAVASTHAPPQQAIINSIPADIRSVLSQLDLETKTTSFVCCPRCCQLYDVGPDPNNPSFPARCTFKLTEDSSPCNRSLRKEDSRRQRVIPTRKFYYQSFSHYLGRMYARNGFEEMLDRNPYSDDPTNMLDIWDGKVLRNFRKDGNLFVPNGKQTGKDGRLVFGINEDGMNPYHNRAAGKNVSVGPIYMVCMNLPRSIRFKMENIYIAGIIPGPSSPRKHQINHLLRPLIDHLLLAWDNGLVIPTPSAPSGRTVFCALIPVIADLPAARHLGGLSSYTSDKWCSECELPRTDCNCLDFRDLTKWIPRSLQRHRDYAQTWRDAATEDEQNAIYKRYGVRWSELLRLPYWDPTQYITIDSMHAFYLGLFQRHVRTIWGMDVRHEDATDMPAPLHTPSAADIQSAQNTFRSGSLFALSSLPVDVLRYLCFSHNLRYSGNMKKLADRLHSYVGSINSFLIVT